MLIFMLTTKNRLIQIIAAHTNRLIQIIAPHTLTLAAKTRMMSITVLEFYKEVHVTRQIKICALLYCRQLIIKHNQHAKISQITIRFVVAFGKMTFKYLHLLHMGCR